MSRADDDLCHTLIDCGSSKYLFPPKEQPAIKLNYFIMGVYNDYTPPSFCEEVMVQPDKRLIRVDEVNYDWTTGKLTGQVMVDGVKLADTLFGQHPVKKETICK